MIIEHALLYVRSGDEAVFEAAIAKAKPLIAASPGFLGIEVRPSVEEAGTRLLLVHWQTVAHHRDGFRQLERYKSWCGLLHHFYNPMPSVSYFGDPL